MKSAPAIYIGTSGWSYKHWRSTFYPEKLKANEWLRFYEKIFSTTELNTTFYRLPKPATVEKWKITTGKNFMFCPKMSRYMSHVKKLNDPGESMLKYFEIMQPLKKKTGPVLVQLPSMVAYHKDKAEAFYKVCKRKYAYYKFALEVRHQSWLEEESIALMKKYNIAFVISQSGAGFPYAELITADHVYVRFHGPDALYASGYSDDQLSYYAALFKQWKADGHSVWAFFNNDINGFAFVNARRLLEFCEG